MSPLTELIGGAKVYGWGSFAEVGDFESIATQIVDSGGTSSITFSSIPSTYTHLQVRGIARTTRATFANDGVKFNFNSDTGANYSRHSFQGSSSGGFDFSNGVNQTYFFSQVAGDGGIANMFGTFVLDILDYKDTNKYKTAKILSGEDNNSSANQQVGIIGLFSGLWQNTNAITSITISGFSGNLKQYSHFALYGIRSA